MALLPSSLCVCSSPFSVTCLLCRTSLQIADHGRRLSTSWLRIPVWESRKLLRPRRLSLNRIPFLDALYFYIHMDYVLQMEMWEG